MNEQRHYTVIFLCDQFPPTQLILLRRGADRPFAPNRYTGIGGKVEDGEKPLDGAVRELEEETGLTDISLEEFGRVILNNGQVLHYFFGNDKQGSVPKSNEGMLERVTVENLFSYDIIPTTKIFLEEWKKRSWDTFSPFTVMIFRDEPDDIDAKVKEVRVEEGLA